MISQFVKFGIISGCLILPALSNTALKIKSSEENEGCYVFICFEEPIKDLGKYSPLTFFYLKEGANFQFCINELEISEKPIKIGEKEIEHSVVNMKYCLTKNTSQLPEMSWETTQGIVQNLKAQKCDSIFSFEKESYSIDIIAENMIVAKMHIFVKNDINFFKGLDISRAAPLWKFRSKSLTF